MVERIAKQLPPPSPLNPVPFSAPPKDILVQPSEIGPGWEVAKIEQNRVNEYSTGRLQASFRREQGGSTLSLYVDVEVYRDSETARAGWRPLAERSEDAVLASCDENWEDARALACLVGNVEIRAFADVRSDLAVARGAMRTMLTRVR